MRPQPSSITYANSTANTLLLNKPVDDNFYVSNPIVHKFFKPSTNSIPTSNFQTHHKNLFFTSQASPTQQ